LTRQRLQLIRIIRQRHGGCRRLMPWGTVSTARGIFPSSSIHRASDRPTSWNFREPQSQYHSSEGHEQRGELLGSGSV
jgi:hypothetical protein